MQNSDLDAEQWTVLLKDQNEASHGKITASLDRQD
jgi:hypothetical protein